MALSDPITNVACLRTWIARSSGSRAIGKSIALTEHGKGYATTLNLKFISVVHDQNLAESAGNIGH